MMYEVQQHLRDAHLAIFEETGIMKDFGGFEVTSIHGLQTKKRYLDMLIDENDAYADRLDMRLKFSVKNK
jgi:hypothetical protein